MSERETTAVPPPGKYLVDPYQVWAEAEGVPIHVGRALDLAGVETRPWPRFDVAGAICHLEGRCDFLAVFVLEIGAGKAASPQRHLCEHVFYIVAGEGETEVERADGSRFTIPWRARTIFTVPMNARHRHRNRSAVPARLAAFSDLRYLFSLYRNARFILDNPHAEGDMPALDTLSRGLGDEGRVPAPLQLGDCTIGTDVIDLAPRSFSCARRQMQGAHVLCVCGAGFTLSWREGADEPVRTAWRGGIVIGAPGMWFHQHFNPAGTPARLVGIELGSSRNPMFRSRRHAYGDTSVYASGSAEIAVGSESARVRAIWNEALGRGA